eukprot:tig00001466_g8788.t1
MARAGFVDSPGASGPGRPHLAALVLLLLAGLQLAAAQLPPASIITLEASTLGNSAASESFTGSLSFGTTGWWRVGAPAALRCRSNFDSPGLCHQIDLYRGNLFITTLTNCANCSAASSWNSDPGTWVAQPAACAADPTAGTGPPTLWDPPSTALPPCVARADGGIERWVTGTSYTLRLSVLSAAAGVLATASATVAIAPAWQLALSLAAPGGLQAGAAYGFGWAAAAGTTCARARVAYAMLAPAAGAAVTVAASLLPGATAQHSVSPAQAAGTYLVAASCASDPSVLPGAPAPAPARRRRGGDGRGGRGGAGGAGGVRGAGRRRPLPHPLPPRHRPHPAAASGPRCFPVCTLGSACTFSYTYDGGWYDCGAHGGCGLKGTGPYALVGVEAQLAFVGPFDASNASLPSVAPAPGAAAWVTVQSAGAVGPGAAGSIAWAPALSGAATSATGNPPVGWHRARVVGKYTGFLTLGAPSLTAGLYLPARGTPVGGSTSDPAPGAFPMNGGADPAGDLLLVTPVRITVESTSGLTAGAPARCRTGDTCRIAFQGLGPGVAVAAVSVVFGAAAGGELPVLLAPAAPVAGGAGAVDWRVPCSLRGAYGAGAPGELPATFQVLVRAVNESLSAGASECFSLAPALCCYDEGAAGGGLRGALGTVTDGAPAGGRYEPNAHCRWAIAPNANATGGNLGAQRPVDKLRLFFTRYAIDPTDSLRIYDGLTPAAPLLFDSGGLGFYPFSSSVSGADPAAAAASPTSGLNIPDILTSGPYALVVFASDGGAQPVSAATTQAGGFSLTYEPLAGFDGPARVAGEGGPPPAGAGEARAAAFDGAGATLLVARQPRGGGPAHLARYDRALSALARAPSCAWGPGRRGRRRLARVTAAQLADAGGAALVVTRDGALALVGLAGAVAVVRTADMALLRSIPAAALAAPGAGPGPALRWDSGALHPEAPFAYFFSSTAAPSRVLAVSLADPAAPYPDPARVVAHPRGPAGRRARRWGRGRAGGGGLLRLALRPDGSISRAAALVPGGLPPLAPPFRLPGPPVAIFVPPPGDAWLYALAADGALAKLRLLDGLPQRVVPGWAAGLQGLPPAFAFAPLGEALYLPQGENATSALALLSLAPALVSDGTSVYGALDGHHPAQAPPPAPAELLQQTFDAASAAAAALAQAAGSPAAGTFLAVPNEAWELAPRLREAEAAVGRWPWGAWAALFADGSSLRTAAPGDPAASGVAAPARPRHLLRRLRPAQCASPSPPAAPRGAGPSGAGPDGIAVTRKTFLPAAPYASVLLAVAVGSPAAHFQQLRVAPAPAPGVPTWPGAEAEAAGPRPVVRRGCGYELRWGALQAPLAPPETLVVQRARLERLAATGPQSALRLVPSNGTDLLLLGAAPGALGRPRRRSSPGGDSAVHGSLPVTVAGASIGVLAPAPGAAATWEVPLLIEWNVTAGCAPAFDLLLAPASPPGAPALYTIAEAVPAGEAPNGTLPLRASHAWAPPSPEAGGPAAGLVAGAYVVLGRRGAGGGVDARGGYEPLGFAAPTATSAPVRVSAAALPAAAGRALWRVPLEVAPGFYQLEVRTAGAGGRDGLGRLLRRTPVVHVVAALLEFESPAPAGPPPTAASPSPSACAPPSASPPASPSTSAPPRRRRAPGGPSLPGGLEAPRGRTSPRWAAPRWRCASRRPTRRAPRPSSSRGRRPSRCPSAPTTSAPPPRGTPRRPPPRPSSSSRRAPSPSSTPAPLRPARAPGPWTRGARVTVRYAAAGAVPTVSLFACPAAAPAACRPLALGVPATGAAAVQVPFDLPLGAGLLRVQSGDDTALYDATGLFPVLPGSIALAAPLRGAVLARGGTHAVEWRATGHFRSIRLLLCAPGGAAGCAPIAPVAPSRAFRGRPGPRPHLAPPPPAPAHAATNATATPSPTPSPTPAPTGEGAGGEAGASGAGGPWRGTLVWTIPSTQPPGVYYIRAEALEDDGAAATTASFTIAVPEGAAAAASLVFAITLAAEYDGWTAEARERLRGAVAGQLAVPLPRLLVLSERPGSVVVTLEVLDDRSAGARTAADVAATVRELTAANRWALGRSLWCGASRSGRSRRGMGGGWTPSCPSSSAASACPSPPSSAPPSPSTAAAAPPPAASTPPRPTRKPPRPSASSRLPPRPRPAPTAPPALPRAAAGRAGGERGGRLQRGAGLRGGAGRAAPAPLLGRTPLKMPLPDGTPAEDA